MVFAAEKSRRRCKWNSVAAGLSISAINYELSILNERLGWMVKKNILEANDFSYAKKLRNRKEVREDANPAFIPGEWGVLKSALSEWVKIKEGDDELKKWRKRWIYNWIFFMNHFGGRPHEVMTLPLGDLETTRCLTASQRFWSV